MASFGKAMREAHFSFATSYVPLNHGSFGTFPDTVREYQRSLQSETEARPDTFIRFTYPSTHSNAAHFFSYFAPACSRNP